MEEIDLWCTQFRRAAGTRCPLCKWQEPKGLQGHCNQPCFGLFHGITTLLCLVYVAIHIFFSCNRNPTWTRIIKVGLQDKYKGRRQNYRKTWKSRRIWQHRCQQTLSLSAPPPPTMSPYFVFAFCFSPCVSFMLLFISWPHRCWELRNIFLRELRGT